MATEPVGTESVEALRAERDALTRRCADAERRVQQLTAQLADAQQRIADLEAAAAEPISIFEAGHDGGAGDGPAGDGSDPRVVSLALAATAVVAGMVALLALLNGNLLTWFGVAMVALTIVLALAAARTRVPPVRVTVSRGVVHAERRGSTYRFDLNSDSTRVEMQGEPGESYWQVRFLRRGMDPIVVDADMVDPKAFVAQLRRYRPEL